MVSDVRVYCVGLGRQFCGYLLPTILAPDNSASLAAVCDLDDGRISTVREEVRACGRSAANEHCQFADLIREAKGAAHPATLFVISTPPGSHFRLAREALENGFNVYVDKPLASTCEEGRILAELAGEKGLALVVGCQRRFEAAYRTLLQEGRRSLGRLTKVHVHLHGRFRDTNENEVENDILIGSGFHVIDTTIWLIGELTGKNLEIEIGGAVLHRWPNHRKAFIGFSAIGVCSNGPDPFTVSLAASSLPPPDSVDELLVLTGTAGELRLKRLQAPRSQVPGEISLTRWQAGGVSVTPCPLVAGKADRGAPLRHLLCCLSRGAIGDLQCTGADSLLTLKCIDSIAEKAVIIGT
jgi:predicted dehydrogenase